MQVKGHKPPRKKKPLRQEPKSEMDDVDDFLDDATAAEVRSPSQKQDVSATSADDGHFPIEGDDDDDMMGILPENDEKIGSTSASRALKSSSSDSGESSLSA